MGLKPALAALAGLALGAAACSPAATVAQTDPAKVEVGVHPESGLEVVPVTITQGTDSWTFAAEVAATSEQQQRGLMFRTHLGPNEGMIFPRDPPRVASFWMKNTVIPLDMIFVGPDGRILNIARETTPYSQESWFSDGPASAVFEIAGGRAAELGIEPGALVEW